MKRVRIVRRKFHEAARNAQRAGDGPGLGDVTAVAHIDKDGAASLVDFDALRGCDPRHDRVCFFEIVGCVFHVSLARLVAIPR